MNELVPVQRVPRAVEGEVLAPKYTPTYADITDLTLKVLAESNRQRRVETPIESEVLRPETPREIMTRDPMYFAANFLIPPTRDWNPSPLMRLLGYTRNPDTCRHERKGFTPRDGWWCKECGDGL